MEEPSRARVILTRRSTFANSLKYCLKETFFPDDPFRHLSKQSPLQRVWKILSYLIPILEWAPKYNLSKFASDFLAGITIASVAIPQSISYAKVVEIPPIVGLYSNFVPPLVYAFFGSSNNLAVGTMAATSLLMVSIIRDSVSPQVEPEMYLYTVFTAAFFSGIFQLGIGLSRLGIVVDFLSRSCMSGFMAGTAAILILQQFKNLLGVRHFTDKTDVITVVQVIFNNGNEWQWQSAVLSFGCLLILYLAWHLKEKHPTLFWVHNTSPLLVVVLGGVAAYLIHGKANGIPIVGDIKKGLNPISISQLQFKSPYVSVALKAGLISGFIASAAGIAAGKSLALLKNEQTDGNKELIAFGMMNIIGSLTSCYLTTGLLSKSAVNYCAGCKTPMSNVVMAICTMLVLVLLAPLFKYIPLAALAAIIVASMLGLIDLHEMRHLFKVDKFDFCICMAAFLGVVFGDMEVGLLLSVGLSIIRALLHVARPAICKLGSLPGTQLYRDIEHYPDSSSIPGILILRMGSPIYFANAGYLRERITRWVEAEERLIMEKDPDLQNIILDMSAVSAIDNSGIEMLFEVQKMLNKRGFKVALTNPSLRVTEKLVAANFIDVVGKEFIFLSISEAVSTLALV